MNHVEEPLVSIIIPTYKRSHMLERAIDSALNQTYKNIEIVVVDDNAPLSDSREKTKLVMQKYNNKKNILYYEMKSNSGGAVARNKGVQISNGEYICFLDDDDEYLPRKIELQVGKFSNSNIPLSVVGGHADIVNEDGKLIRTERISIKGDVYKRQLRKNTCSNAVAMIKRNIFDSVGGFEKIPSSQEHLLFIKLFSKCPNFDYVDDVVAKINFHNEERISTNLEKPKGAIMLHDYVKSIYSNLPMDERKDIDRHHYKNIAIAYLSINNKIEAIRYIFKIIKSKKCINKDSLKLLILTFIYKIYVKKSFR